jgi:sugar O-acyltransferase (sialic acid O-acetyltransferase NeuD family)
VPEPRPRVTIVGIGGFGRELAALLISGDTDPRWELGAIVDDDEARHGMLVGGIKVTGPTSSVRNSSDLVVIAVGNPRNREVRRQIEARLGLPDERYAVVIAADAYVGSGCAVGVGTVLMPGVVCTADVTVGRHTNVMPNCTLTHDVRVGDFVAIGAGAQLAGGASIGNGAYLGSGALLREGVRVGAGSLVGMGSVVLHDVPDGQVWAGSPARRLR